MELQYIFGGAGAGKTEHCLNRISEHSALGQTVIYIVPEQFTLESEKSLCAAAAGGAVVSAQVLSFQRLAFRLFAESGPGPRHSGRLLDDAGKNMLLRKLTLEHAGELRFFGRNLDKQGFIDNLHATFREFSQYNADAKRLLACARGLTGQGAATESLRRKMLDLCGLYAHYQETLASGYMTAENALDLAPERVDGSALLTGALVFIDGFNGFTPQEYRIMERLLRTCAQVSVCLTIKSDRVTHNSPETSDPFYEIKRSVNRLTAMAAENGVPVSRPLYLMEAHRFKGFPELAFLEKNFFNYHRNKYSAKAENIRIFAAENSHGEITLAAENILCLVRDEGYRYGDIALAAAEPANLELAIRGVFESFGIPFFMDAKPDVLSHPLTELIRAAVDIAAYDWPYEAVFRFLKTSLAGLSPDDVDTLENYALAFGVSGWKWREPQWLAGFNDNSEGGFNSGRLYDRERIHALKERVSAAAAPFTGVAGRPGGAEKHPARRFAEGIFNMLDELDVCGELERWARDAARRGDNLAASRHGQIWGKICGVFEKLVDILGDERMTARAFTKVLEAGFAATDMGLIPPTGDQVVICDIERSRLPAVKALLLVGVNEGVLPGVKKETGLFADAERELLRERGLELGPDSRRKSYSEQYLIYLRMMGPSQKLLLSYSEGSLSGKAMRPSPLIAGILRLFPDIRVQPAAERAGVTRPLPMLLKMGGLLRRAATGQSAPQQWEEARLWLSRREPYAARLRAMEKIAAEGGAGRREPESLSPATASALYAGNIVTGVSRLEQYVKCPFAHFARHQLRARPRQLYEATSLDYGDFFHKVLESFTGKLAARGESFRDVTGDDIDDLVDGCVREIAPELANQVLLSTAKFRGGLERASRISKRSVWALARHLRRGLFEPAGWEVSFGDENVGGMGAVPVPIDESRAFLLTGRIDRVDVAEIDGARYVKVIDYKSGATRFDMAELRFGTQLQLMVYCDALIKKGAALFGDGPPLRPGGVFYFGLANPLQSVNEAVDDARLEEMALKKFKMSGLALKDESVVRAMDAEMAGHSPVIPVGLFKTGFAKTSSAATLDEFDALRRETTAKIAAIGRDMARGNIAARPYKKEKDGSAACDYCDYRAVCQIETAPEKGKYRIIAKNRGNAD